MELFDRPSNWSDLDLSRIGRINPLRPFRTGSIQHSALSIGLRRRLYRWVLRLRLDLVRSTDALQLIKVFVIDTPATAVILPTFGPEDLTLTISRRRHSVSVRPSVRPWSYINSLWSGFLTNRLREFHQIYNSGAVGDKDELIWLWGPRSFLLFISQTWSSYCTSRMNY